MVYSKSNGLPKRIVFFHVELYLMPQKDLGQYFTRSNVLRDFVFHCVRNRGDRLLEPSFGAGHLLLAFKALDPDYPMDCYELDSTIPLVVQFNSHQTVSYADFIATPIPTTYRTIIGNPPYVKRRAGNLYIQFIEKCVGLLAPGGELIFIVPSDFLKQTRSSAILTRMMQEGCFTDVLFPHNERLFDGASIDVMVFRYEKGIQSRTTRVNGLLRTCQIQGGIVSFADQTVQGTPLSEMFNVYVGLVSGMDAVYKVPFGNVGILTDKDVITPFILVDTYPCGNTQIAAHKDALMGRKIKKFGETNWFEWGAPRNKRAMDEHIGKPCIYVRNLTRQSEVAFAGTVSYFGGALLCLIPKQPMDLAPVLAHLNSSELKNEYTFSGRFKIGHNQVSNILMRTSS
jgi:adenine-specific DNA-methyltransferase